VTSKSWTTNCALVEDDRREEKAVVGEINRRYGSNAKEGRMSEQYGEMWEEGRKAREKI